VSLIRPDLIRVALDAHVVGHRGTGNETYIVGLTDALAARADIQRLVFVDKGVEWPGSSAPELHRLRARTPFLRIPIELPLAVRRARADLLHVQYVAPPLAGVPVVATIHDLSFEDVPGLFRKATEVRLRLSVRATVRVAAAIVTISEFTRARLVDRYRLPSERVFVTPVAISGQWRPLDAEERARRLHDLGISGPFVLAVGNMHRRKNLPRLIRAVAALRHEAGQGLADLQLVLVGQRGWKAGEVDAAIDAVNGRSWVHLAGFVPDAVLQALYGAARVVAYVSLYEGLGLPVLEALACGAVVLASSTTAVPETAGNAAVLVDPADDDAVTAGLLRALNDDSLRVRLTAAGPAWAATFTLERFADSTVAAYRAALA
jgi:glycosyltransferase involved in cell wall biosynthesis